MYAGDMAGLMDGEYSGSYQVYHAKPNLQDQGGERLAEVWDVSETENARGHHPTAVHGRLEI